MQNSQVRSSVLCGVVAGILIGASTVFTAQGFSLTAALVQQVSYREIGEAESFKRRDLSQQQQMEARRAARQVEREQSVSSIAPSSVAPLPVVDVDCVAKVQIVLDLKARVLPLIPARPIDLIVYDNVLKEFDRTLIGCEGLLPAVQSHSSVPAASAAAVPSKPSIDPQVYCAKYTGSRRTQCLGELLKNGILY